MKSLLLIPFLLSCIVAFSQQAVTISNDSTYGPVLSIVDADLYRIDSAKLKTHGALGFDWNVGEPSKLAGLSDNFLTGVEMSESFYFENDTVELNFSSVRNKLELAWLDLHTGEPGDGSDTICHINPVIIGSDTLVKRGTGTLQIQDTTSVPGSALDIFSNGWYRHGARWYNNIVGGDNPTTFINGVGAFYSRMWMVISAAEAGSGDSYTLIHPSSESFMLGIMSDVGGPTIQARQSSAPGSHNFSSLNQAGDHTWKLEGDGTHRWGTGTLSSMDTDLFRADSACLKTHGTFGFDWNIGNPNRLAAMNGTFLTGADVGGGLYFDEDTLKINLDYFNNSAMSTDEDNIYIGTHNADVAGSIITGTLCEEASDQVLDLNANVVARFGLNIPKGTPESSSAYGNAGDIMWDDEYLYICIDKNTWHRVSHSW